MLKKIFQSNFTEFQGFTALDKTAASAVNSRRAADAEKVMKMIKVTPTPLQERTTKRALMIVGGTAMLTVLAVHTPEVLAAFTAAPDQEFKDLYLKISGYLNGLAGRIVCMLIAIIGIVQGIQKSSMWAIVMGLGVAIALTNFDKIIGSFFGVEYVAHAISATIPNAVHGVTLIK